MFGAVVDPSWRPRFRDVTANRVVRTD